MYDLRSGTYVTTRHCTRSLLNFSEIPLHNLDIGTPSSCLMFYKGATAKESKIVAVDCNSLPKGVVCTAPVHGCDLHKP